MACPCCSGACDPQDCPNGNECSCSCRCVDKKCVACNPKACPDGYCNLPCKCINGECKNCVFCDGGFIRTTWEVSGTDCNGGENFWYCQESSNIPVDCCTDKIQPSFLKVFRLVGSGCTGNWSDRKIIEGTLNDSAATTFPSATNPPCGGTGLTITNVTTYWQYNYPPYTQCDCSPTAIQMYIVYPTSSNVGCTAVNAFPRNL